MNKNSSEISKLMFSANERFKSCPTVIPGQVRIIHGKGTGLLRQGIHSYLKRLSYVKSYRLGVFGEGDSGVTIVELK